MTPSAEEAADRGGGGVVRTALGLSLVAGAACVALAGSATGGEGARAAAMGTGVTVAFFGFGHGVLTAMRRISPALLLLIALLTYALQVVILLALFAAFARNPTWSDAVSTTWLGATILTCTLSWTVGLIVAAGRGNGRWLGLRGGSR